MRTSTLLLPFVALFASGCDDVPASSRTDASTKTDTPNSMDATSDSDVVASTSCIPATMSGNTPTDRFVDGTATATVTIADPAACLRTYTLSSTAPLRDGQPGNPRRFTERAGFSTVRTGNNLLDALYALAQEEARENSVAEIRDGSFNDGAPITCAPGGCFETGRLWKYVWTRDTSFSVHLALGALDPTRARNSLDFKLSERRGGGDLQIVQDTGTGGSYPVSTDRVVWALGASEVLKFLSGEARETFLTRSLTALRNTLAHDRAVIYDTTDGLYRGEHSFLDWREQSYPAWTATDNAHIAMSKSLSTNVLHYAALDTASRFATERSEATVAQMYREQANALRSAIRTRFWDADAGQFRAYSTTGLDPAPVRRWDLLGTSLAVLLGVADDTQARAAIENYPHAGRGGAPVLWPQQQATAIYHNRAMWPFVTAYFARAARQVRNDGVVNRATQVLVRSAALNLSNMENLEVVSGTPRVEEGATSGPVVNSQRQLWSVAGFLSLVHDVIFGVEVTQDGLLVQPYITREMRSGMLANADTMVLNQYVWRGKNITVIVRLPPRGENRAGAYAVGSRRLNGRDMATSTVTAAILDAQNNQLEIALTDTPEAASRIREVADTTDWRAVFGPRTPSVSRVDTDPSTGRIRVNFDAGGEPSADVRFNIYRMGQRVASDLPGSTTTWTDSTLRDGASPEACYVVESVFVSSGNTSQRSQPQCWWGHNGHLVRSILAYDFTNTGGSPSNNHGRFHYENWGDAGHQLEVGYFRPDATGDHLVQLMGGNGSGGYTTGITAAVKRIRIQELPANTTVATGYVTLPQAGEWSQWRGSTLMRVRLDATRTYRMIVDSDERAVNMSTFAHFERYTGGTGGRSGAFNRVNISEVRVLPLHGGMGNATTVSLDGDGDLEAFGADGRLNVGATTAPTDGVSMRFDDAYVYFSVRSRALGMNDLRPFVLYFEAQGDGETFGAPVSRVGMMYLDQTPTVPFEAQWAVLVRRRSDVGDGAGPFNGLFRWDTNRWVRAMRFVENQQYWVGNDADRTLSVRLPRSQFGATSRMRMAGHVVQGGGFYNVTLPAEHQPWTTGRTTGFYEIDLTTSSPARLWSIR
jgi:hypothetical protein